MAHVDQTFICLTFADDTVGIMGYVTAEYRQPTWWERIASRLLARPVKRRARWRSVATRENVNALIARLGIRDPHVNESAIPQAKLPVKQWCHIGFAEIPEDRTYRNALRWVDDAFTYDMTHARELHRGYLRRARERGLLALDVAYWKATEQGNDQRRERIAAEKQYLRDLPQLPAIEAANEVYELKQVWPLELVLAEIDHEMPTLAQLLA